MVPIVGTKIDEEALTLALKLARTSKGKVCVVYVITVKRALPLEAEIEPEVVKAERVLEWAERVAEEQDAEVETDLLQAREAGPALVDEAVERKVDLILMGVSYNKRFGEFSLGSTSQYVLKNAPCPVLIYREPISD